MVILSRPPRAQASCTSSRQVSSSLRPVETVSYTHLDVYKRQALALAPALRGGLILPGHIIIDSKSGVTGAGRGLTQGSHFPEANEAFSAYKIAQHRHCLLYTSRCV